MKKKLKYIYRIFGVLLTFVVIWQFFGCFSDNGPVEKSYRTVEELQYDFPDFYYFNFDLENIQVNEYCYAISHDDRFVGCHRVAEEEIDFCGYRIGYKFDTNDNISGYSYIKITCDAKSTFDDIYYRGGENEIVLNLVIDGIDCIFFYYISGSRIINISFYFEIDNVLYGFFYGDIDFEYENVLIEKDEFLDWCLHVAESGITGRYKPNQEDIK